MDLLGSLSFFVAIIERGGVAAAGRAFGLSAAASSERLAALERHYGVALLTRTTRSFSLTEEGEIVLAAARRLSATAQELETRIQLGVDELSGRIRVAAPEDLGAFQVATILDEFKTQHPNVQIELHLSDHNVDLAGRGFDFALRYGQLDDSSMIVRRVLNNHRVICASPAYIEQHGAPEKPADLSDHNCLRMQFGQTIWQDWRFDVAGEIQSVRVRGDRTSNNGALVRRWCVEGYGVAQKARLDVQDDINDGRLIPVLGDFVCRDDQPLQIVHPKGASQTRRARAAIEFVVQALRQKATKEQSHSATDPTGLEAT